MKHDQLPPPPLPGGLVRLEARREQALRAVPFRLATLLRVIEGEKHVRLPVGEVCARAGQTLLIPAGVRLDFGNRPDPRSGRYVAFCVEFDRAVFERLAVAYPEIPPLLHRPVAPLLLPALAELAAPLLGLQTLLDSQQLGSAWVLHHKLAILLTLAEAGLGGGLLPGREVSMAERVRTLVSLDPARKWLAAELAGQLACSEATLRRKLAAEATNLTTLLEEVRLALALGLIQTSQQPIAEIAARVGYDSPSRFSQRFRSAFGSQPSALR